MCGSMADIQSAAAEIWTTRDAICDVDSGGPEEALVDGGAHSRHLANTTEQSICNGDVALYQITLTTCFLLVIYCLL